MRPRSRFVGPARCALEGCTWLCKEDESTNPLLCEERRARRPTKFGKGWRPIAQAQGARIACALQQPRDPVLILIQSLDGAMEPLATEDSDEGVELQDCSSPAYPKPAPPPEIEEEEEDDEDDAALDADARARAAAIAAAEARSAAALWRTQFRATGVRVLRTKLRSPKSLACELLMPLMLMSLLVWAYELSNIFSIPAATYTLQHACFPDGCAANGHLRHTVDDDGGAGGGADGGGGIAA